MTKWQPWSVGTALVAGVFLGTLFGPLFAQKKEEPSVKVPTVGRYQPISSPGGVAGPRVLDTATGEIWDWAPPDAPQWESVIPPIPVQK
jgi:hypothetical protein